MKYAVKVEYQLSRTLRVFAQTPAEARLKAEKIVKGWDSAYEVKATTVVEEKERPPK